MSIKIAFDLFSLLLSGFALWYAIKVRREFLRECAEIEAKTKELREQLEKAKGFLVID